MSVSLPYSFSNSTVADATEVNANFDALADAFDGYLPLSGGTLTGPVVLPNSSPTLNNHAARKKYVDDSIAAINTTPADGSVTTAKLADSAVSTAKIADDAVTLAKLADASVDLGSAVTTGSLQLSKLENVAYSTFTATLKRGNTTVGSTTSYARYRREGRRISGHCKVTATANNSTSDEIYVGHNLPAPLNNDAIVGTAVFIDMGVGYRTLAVRVQSSTFSFVRDGESALFGFSQSIGNSSGTYDYIQFNFDYEAAS